MINQETGNVVYINKGMVINGDITSDSPMLVNGDINGSAVTTSEVLINGRICGDVSAADITVNGSVNGNVVSDGHVDLFSSSSLEGSIKSHGLNIRNGAKCKASIEIE